MTTATLIGLGAAILIILNLVVGELDILFPDVIALELFCAGAALFSLLLVIAAAVILMLKSAHTYRQIAAE